MDDQRTENRTHLIYYLRVFDKNTQALFGHVVDISGKGMLITSDKPMQADRRYELAVEDVTSIERLQTIATSAECRWCQEDQGGGLFDGGFQFVDPPKALSNLLNYYR